MDSQPPAAPQNPLEWISALRRVLVERRFTTVRCGKLLEHAHLCIGESKGEPTARNKYEAKEPIKTNVGRERKIFATERLEPLELEGVILRDRRRDFRRLGAGVSIQAWIEASSG